MSQSSCPLIVRPTVSLHRPDLRRRPPGSSRTAALSFRCPSALEPCPAPDVRPCSRSRLHPFCGGRSDRSGGGRFGFGSGHWAALPAMSCSAGSAMGGCGRRVSARYASQSFISSRRRSNRSDRAYAASTPLSAYRSASETRDCRSRQASARPRESRLPAGKAGPGARASPSSAQRISSTRGRPRLGERAPTCAARCRLGDRAPAGRGRRGCLCASLSRPPTPAPTGLSGAQPAPSPASRARSA